MANLFWEKKTETKSLFSTPFKNEEEFEKIIFETPEILEDILDINGDTITGQGLGKTPYAALKKWLTKKDFGLDKVDELLDPEPVGDGMWQTDVMIGEMVASNE